MLPVIDQRRRHVDCAPFECIMGAASSAQQRSAACEEARAILGAEQLVALDALFAASPERCLPADAFTATPLGRRLFALLCSQPPTSEVSEEAFTTALAACHSDDGASALVADLLGGGDAQQVIADAIAGDCPLSTREVCLEVAACVLCSLPGDNDKEATARWAVRSAPALLRAVKHALSVPRLSRPLSLVTLDCGGAPSSALVLNPAWAWYLGPHLTKTAATWTLLFNSDAHGKSFRSLSGRSCNRGAVLVLVKEAGGDGGIAGGCTDAPLTKRAAFFGGYRSALIQLRPTARVFRPSGANTNCCWFAEGFESVPNGIAFGGQVGHFALFVQEALEKGHSRMSATFNNQPLLGSGLAGSFAVDVVETWSLDAQALQEFHDATARAARKAAADGGSVLDARAQDRKFMQIAHAGDRFNASDGVR